MHEQNIHYEKKSFSDRVQLNNTFRRLEDNFGANTRGKQLSVNVYVASPSSILNTEGKTSLGAKK